MDTGRWNEPVRPADRRLLRGLTGLARRPVGRTHRRSPLNDVTSGFDRIRARRRFGYICAAGSGYDGPTGVGSISGDVVTGGPGIAGPSYGSGTDRTRTRRRFVKRGDAQRRDLPQRAPHDRSWEYGTTSG